MDPSHRYDSLIEYYGEKYNIDWHMLWQQIKAESNFNPEVTSHAGAQGLTQFEPSTFNDVSMRQGWGQYASPFNPEYAIHAQAAFMSGLYKQFGGDMRKALAAYNAGAGRVGTLVRQYGVKWEDFLPDETKQYLINILGS
jgi:soluble lytic murein transglycosylase-like protein